MAIPLTEKPTYEFETNFGYMENDDVPELGETSRVLGDGGEWIFPSICLHSNYKLYKRNLKWFGSRI